MVNRDDYFLVLIVVCAINFLFFSIFLLYPDLIFDYPFVGGDTHDWLANGYFMAGHDVRYSVRPPLLPILIALLVFFSKLSLLPVVIQFVVHVTAIVFYVFLSKRTKRVTAFVTTIALLFNYSFQNMSLEIMADVLAASFFLLAVIFILSTRFSKAFYIPAGILAGLSAATQQTALLLPLPLAVSVFSTRREDFKNLWFYGGICAFIVLPGSWFLYKFICFHTFGDVLVWHFNIVKLHMDSAGHYVYSFFSLFGFAGGVLVLMGVLFALKRRHFFEEQFLLLLFASILFFFIFVYDYDDKRFLVYIFWLGGIFIAEALSRFKNRFIFFTAAVLLLASSVMPFPEKGSRPENIAVFPPLFLKTDVSIDAFSGAVSANLGNVSYKVSGFDNLFLFSNFFKVTRARDNFGKQERIEGLNHEKIKNAAGCIFFYDETNRKGQKRYLIMNQLSCALMKKVKFLPQSFYFSYEECLKLKPVGVLNGFFIFKSLLPYSKEEWLFAVSADNPIVERFSENHIHKDSICGDGTAFQEAGRIGQFIGKETSMVLIFPDYHQKDYAIFYLPFMIQTTEIFMLPEKNMEQKKEMALKNCDMKHFKKKTVGGQTVIKTNVFGRPSVLIGDVS